MARKWWIPLSALAVAAAAVLLWPHRISPARQTIPASVPPPEAILMGPVTPRHTVSIAPPDTGVLDAWFVEPGQIVIKDQLLARVRVTRLEDAARQAQADADQLSSRAESLDAAQIAAKLEISRAEAEQSRAAAEADRLQKIYQRYKNLWDLGAIARLQFEKSEKDYQDAKTAAGKADQAVKAAHDRADALAAESEAARRQIAEREKAAEQAKSDLSGGDLHSPADGIVLARQGDPGQPVDPSMTSLMQIATDLTELQVTLTPEPQQLARMHPAQPVEVHFAGGDFAGTVREIRDAQALVDFSASAPLAKLGDTAQVKIKF